MLTVPNRIQCQRHMIDYKAKIKSQYFKCAEPESGPDLVIDLSLSLPYTYIMRGRRGAGFACQGPKSPNSV